MVDQIRDALEKLNAALAASDATPYRLGVAAPDELKPAPKNAHFMTQETFTRLTENIARDGNLSSLPFCWKSRGKFHILSGHHRVDAAQAAGVELVLFLYTTAKLSKGERVAIQLAHNAIVGQDNLAILKELYEEIDRLDLMEYTGIDDRTVERFDEIVPPTFQDAGLDFEEVSLLFLPAEFDRIKEIAARLGEYRGVEVFVAGRQDWGRFWETLLRFKERRNIYNTATAVAAMTEIVAEWLEEQDQEVVDGERA